MTTLLSPVVGHRISTPMYLARAAGLVVLCAIPVISLLRPRSGPLVWNLVSLLPVIIVLLGYHRWRQVCPLYLLSRLPGSLAQRRGRRAPKWLEANAYYLAFGLFLVSIWLRLVVMNGNGRSIAVYFVALAVVAISVDHVFTGRTWCNYFCPMSFLERIYTEASGSRKATTSQCATCTGCKKACPDIDLKGSYQIEIPLAAKRFAYFAFPGTVVGFFAYFYLQSGNSHALIATQAQLAGFAGGALWPGRNVAAAGLVFLNQMPRSFGALLTLVACSLASFAVFSGCEYLFGAVRARFHAWSEPLAARHVLFAMAAFISFVTFYTCVGRAMFGTTLWTLAAFELGGVGVGSVVLVRRLHSTVFASDRTDRGDRRPSHSRELDTHRVREVAEDADAFGPDGRILLDELHQLHRRYSTRTHFQADARRLADECWAVRSIEVVSPELAGPSSWWRYLRRGREPSLAIEYVRRVRWVNHRAVPLDW